MSSDDSDDLFSTEDEEDVYLRLDEETLREHARMTSYHTAQYSDDDYWRNPSEASIESEMPTQNGMSALEKEYAQAAWWVWVGQLLVCLACFIIVCLVGKSLFRSFTDSPYPITPVADIENSANLTFAFHPDDRPMPSTDLVYITLPGGCKARRGHEKLMARCKSRKTIVSCRTMMDSCVWDHRGGPPGDIVWSRSQLFVDVTPAVLAAVSFSLLKPTYVVAQLDHVMNVTCSSEKQWCLDKWFDQAINRMNPPATPSGTYLYISGETTKSYARRFGSRDFRATDFRVTPSLSMLIWVGMTAALVASIAITANLRGFLFTLRENYITEYAETCDFIHRRDDLMAYMLEYRRTEKLFREQRQALPFHKFSDAVQKSYIDHYLRNRAGPLFMTERIFFHSPESYAVFADAAAAAELEPTANVFFKGHFPFGMEEGTIEVAAPSPLWWSELKTYFYETVFHLLVVFGTALPTLIFCMQYNQYRSQFGDFNLNWLHTIASVGQAIASGFIVVGITYISLYYVRKFVPASGAKIVGTVMMLIRPIWAMFFMSTLFVSVNILCNNVVWIILGMLIKPHEVMPVFTAIATVTAHIYIYGTSIWGAFVSVVGCVRSEIELVRELKERAIEMLAEDKAVVKQEIDSCARRIVELSREKDRLIPPTRTSEQLPIGDELDGLIAVKNEHQKSLHKYERPLQMTLKFYNDFVRGVTYILHKNDISRQELVVGLITTMTYVGLLFAFIFLGIDACHTEGVTVSIIATVLIAASAMFIHVMAWGLKKELDMICTDMVRHTNNLVTREFKFLYALFAEFPKIQQQFQSILIKFEDMVIDTHKATIATLRRDIYAAELHAKDAVQQGLINALDDADTPVLASVSGRSAEWEDEDDQKLSLRADSPAPASEPSTASLRRRRIRQEANSLSTQIADSVKRLQQTYTQLVKSGQG